jgi:hypothetical protein
MKIESGRGVSSSAGSKGAGRTAAPGFSVATEAPQRAAATTGVSAVPSLDAVLALQGEEPSSQRRARQARRGKDSLDALEKLEQGLVLGRAPGGLKAELEALSRGAEATGDTDLDAVLLEIDTRVAVELAKLDALRAA